MKKMIYACAAVLAVTACSKNNAANPFQAAKQAAEVANLQKTFVSSCSIKPASAMLSFLFTAGKSTIQSQNVAYTFKGLDVRRTTRIYTSNDCSGDAAGNFVESGVYKANKDKSTNDGSHDMNMTFDKLEVQIVNQQGADAANAEKLCGSSGWHPGSKQEVTGNAADANCYGVKLPREFDTVYQVQDNKLFLGSDKKANQDGKARDASADKSNVFTSK